jgi:2-hydroxychromene-2-carboxylate isomerase
VTLNSKVTIYFSFRSPYSWLAYHDLQVTVPDLLDEAHLRPFWEPDAHSEMLLTEAGGRFIYVPMSAAKQRYILGDIRRLAARRSLAVTWPVDRDPWWDVSHLTYLAAEDHGLGRTFLNRIYHARWQEGRDICDQATVDDIAVNCGLPAGTVASAVETAEGRAAGTSALLAAFNDDIFGVPYFLNGRQRFWGIDRLPDFLDSLTSGNLQKQDALVAFGPELLTPSPSRSADDGHVGGCG